MVLFVGPTKLLPAALDVFVVWAAATDCPLVANPSGT
jgi:hypothetical protein